MDVKMTWSSNTRPCKDPKTQRPKDGLSIASHSQPQSRRNGNDASAVPLPWRMASHWYPKNHRSGSHEKNHAAPAWSFQNFHGWAMSSPSFCLAFPYQFSTLRPPVSSNMACCKKSTIYLWYVPSKPPFSAGISQLAIFWWHRCVPVLSHPQIQAKEFQLGAVGKHALLGHSSGPGPLKVKWLILPTIVVIHSPQLMRG